MGLFDFIRKQFVDIIQWTEDAEGTLAYRFPMDDLEIQNGSQLTVRETQLALFVHEGEAADLFGPGMHVLQTRSIPVMSALRNWDKGFESPFKADVVFFNTREQLDQRWGTQQPITVRDTELGIVRLRAHGTYTYRLQDPKLFHRKVSGTRERVSTADLDGQLRSLILTTIASFFGEKSVPFLDMAAHQGRFSSTMQEALLPEFAAYGLELTAFQLQSLSLPEEVQARLDRVTSMRAIGDLGAYTRFQAADSLSTPGGAGTGVAAEMVAGLAMGQALQGSFEQKASPAEDPLTTIGKLHDLMTRGILTRDEFEAKKAELLKKVL